MGISTTEVDNSIAKIIQNIADEIGNKIGIILNNIHPSNTNQENNYVNILIDIKSDDNSKIISNNIFEHLDNKQQEINNFQLFKDSVFKIINENKDNNLWKKYNISNELREYIIFLQTQHENEININNIQNFKDIESVTTAFLNKIKNNKYNKKDFKVDLFEDLNYIKNQLNNEEEFCELLFNLIHNTSQDYKELIDDYIKSNIITTQHYVLYESRQNMHLKTNESKEDIENKVHEILQNNKNNGEYKKDLFNYLNSARIQLNNDIVFCELISQFIQTNKDNVVLYDYIIDNISEEYIEYVENGIQNNIFAEIIETYINDNNKQELCNVLDFNKQKINNDKMFNTIIKYLIQQFEELGDDYKNISNILYQYVFILEENEVLSGTNEDLFKINKEIRLDNQKILSVN